MVKGRLETRLFVFKKIIGENLLSNSFAISRNPEKGDRLILYMVKTNVIVTYELTVTLQIK
jgi:hypothetical protein